MRFRARWVVAVAAGCAAVVLGASGAAVAAPSPGAPGIGDPYYPDYGNGGYTVSHYDLGLRYQPATDALQGTATILASATQDLSRFDLDFALTTSSVLVNNRPAKFAASGAHELVITPDRPVAKGQPMTVVVRYSGIPSQVKVTGFTSWMRTDDGAIGANEPENAWWWFPSNDHPLDKASYDIAITVPDGYQAVSNGLHTGNTEKLGWTTWKWRETRPMATYLALFAVGHYDLRTDTTPGGLPVVEAYDTGLGADDGAARSSVGRTGEIVDWETSIYGPYPFDALGGLVPNFKAGFALENQTRPMYGKDFFEKGSDPYVVVHENAHQWYGDSVSVHHWSDIWLNEGFAGYTEWLWSEHSGEGTAEQVALYTYNQHPASDKLWTVLPGDPGAAHQFDDAVYDRGAMCLQALRNTVGDKAFFQIMRTWAQSRKDGNGTIPEFVDLSQKVSGKDLKDLFHTWLFTVGKPPPSAFGSPSAMSATATPQPKSWPQLRRTRQLLAGKSH